MLKPRVKVDIDLFFTKSFMVHLLLIMPLSITSITKDEYGQVAAEKVVFSQSTGWADLRAINGYRSDYFAVYENKKIVGAFLVLIKTKRLFKLSITAAYLPRPSFFFEGNRHDGISEILNFLKQRYHAVVVEYNYPHWIKDGPSDKGWQDTVAKQGKSAGYITSNAHIQPDASIIKFVGTNNIYDSLASKYARRDARRGLRKSQELGITFQMHESLDDKNLERVEQLMELIAESRGFRTRNASYLAAFQENVPGVRWFTAEYKGQIISATATIKDSYSNTDYSIYIGYQNPLPEEIYLTYTGRVYILETLQKEGVGYYDQWGISEDPKSPLFKLSETKKRFGGDIVYYPKQLIGSRIPGMKYLVKGLSI